MYKDMFPEVELALPASRLPKEAMDSKARRKAGIKDNLRLAIEEEKTKG